MKTTITTLLLILTVPALAAAGELQDDLLALEKAMWTAWGAGEGDMFRQHLTEDHVQVVAGVGPVVGREAIATGVEAGGCELRSFDFQDAKLRQLTADVVILSYTATQDASCEGTALPPKIRSTSIYVLQEGEWMSASYQETPVD